MLKVWSWERIRNPPSPWQDRDFAHVVLRLLLWPKPMLSSTTPPSAKVPKTNWSHCSITPFFFLPETFMTSLVTSSSSPHSAQSSGFSHPHSSSSPSSPPAWARLTERPPGLKTYRSSSRGALRLTIKQESGSRKVIHNSACDLGLKRDHTGQLTNGGGGVNERQPQATNGAPRHSQYGDEISVGTHGCNAAQQVPQTVPDSEAKPPLPMTEAEDVCFEIPTRDIGAPKLKCYKVDVSPQPEQRFSPASLPFQEDNILSEHLQSAIDSILELQRLQGPSVAPGRAAPGPSLDQPVTSILGGHLWGNPTGVSTKMLMAMLLELIVWRKKTKNRHYKEMHTRQQHYL